jgi:hypothetical protein
VFFGLNGKAKKVKESNKMKTQRYKIKKPYFTFSRISPTLINLFPISLSMDLKYEINKIIVIILTERVNKSNVKSFEK